MPDTTQRPLITGSRLRELRKASGKTQVELAQELGVQQAHISQLEAGRGELSVALLVRLAQVFGVTTDYLVGLSDHSAMLAAVMPPTDAVSLPGHTVPRHQGRVRKAVPEPVQEETCVTGRN